MAMRLMMSCLLLGGLASFATADVVPDTKGGGAKKDRPKKDVPLEQQLLDDLDDDLLDDLKSAAGVKPTKGKADERPARDDGDQPLDKKLLEDIDDLEPGGEDFGATTGDNEEEDPFLTIGREMRKAGELIGKHKSAGETQQLQEKIVVQLDALIKNIRRQQKRQQSASKQKPAGSTRHTPKQPGQKASGKPGHNAKKPSRDSEDRLGKSKPRKVDMAAMRKLMEDLWGSLPERARQEAAQRVGDDFHPKYDLKIEKYFRRLAEQRRDE